MNRFVTIKNPVDGAPKECDFETKAEALSLKLEPGTNDIIVKNLYVSIDPYQINRIKSRSSSQSASSFAVRIIPGDVSRLSTLLKQKLHNSLIDVISCIHDASLLTDNRCLWCGQSCCFGES